MKLHVSGILVIFFGRKNHQYLLLVFWSFSTLAANLNDVCLIEYWFHVLLRAVRNYRKLRLELLRIVLLSAFLALKVVFVLDALSLDEIVFMAFASVTYESFRELDWYEELDLFVHIRESSDEVNGESFLDLAFAFRWNLFFMMVTYSSIWDYYSLELRRGAWKGRLNP